MPLAIRETARAGDSSEQTDVRARRFADQLHKRNRCAYHHTAEQAGSQHAQESRHRHHKLRTIIVPEFFKVESLSKLATATNTTAASTGCGKALRRWEKKRTTTRMKTAARAVESGVCAPPSSLTSDCDVPPLTGKPLPTPATRFDTASARFS